MTRKWDPSLEQYRDKGKFAGNDGATASGGMSALSDSEPHQSAVHTSDAYKDLMAAYKEQDTANPQEYDAVDDRINRGSVICVADRIAEQWPGATHIELTSSDQGDFWHLASVTAADGGTVTPDDAGLSTAQADALDDAHLWLTNLNEFNPEFRAFIDVPHRGSDTATLDLAKAREWASPEPNQAISQSPAPAPRQVDQLQQMQDARVQQITDAGIAYPINWDEMGSSAKDMWEERQLRGIARRAARANRDQD